MLPFIHAPAITHCHGVSSGTGADVTQGSAQCAINRWREHCLSCPLGSNRASSFKTWPFDVQLCLSVSCCFPAFLPGQRCSSQYIVCPPKTVPTSFERTCRLGDKAPERMGFESANGSRLAWSFYSYLHFCYLKRVGWYSESAHTASTQVLECTQASQLWEEFVPLTFFIVKVF